MNKKGQKSVLGFSLLILVFLFIITSFVFIEPFKETFDTIRGSSNLNCRDVAGFNATDYADDTTLEKLTRRPTCVATGFTTVWFIFAWIIAVVTWAVRNWKKIA